MEWQAQLTLVVLAGVLALLATTALATDVVLVAGLVVLLVTGVISPEQALSGFSNEGVVTIAALFVVVAGLRDTGVTQILSRYLLRRPKSTVHAQWQVMAPVTLMSAFINNTPVVAALIPAVSDWCRRFKLSTSKLMMPLSFAAMLGGTCTLIGTSTNLLVNSLMQESHLGQLGMFELAWVGIPTAVLGMAFIMLTSKWLLPNRNQAITEYDDPREYSFCMRVVSNGPLHGQTIEQAGLRQLPGMFLAGIERNGQMLAAVSPRQPLQGGDILQFVGVVDSVIDLQKRQGLMPLADIDRLDAPRHQRELVEVVVAVNCPAVGKTVRESGFREHYRAAILAIARDGERLHGKIGSIVLKPGDVLLLEARVSFARQQRYNKDFYLASRVEDMARPNYQKSALALTTVAAMVLVVTLGWLSILKAALLAAGAMLVLRCCSISAARKSLDWPLFIAIAAAIGLAGAVQSTGLATHLASALLGLTGDHVYGALAGLFSCTVLIGAVVTNNATAVIMFPIAVSLAASLQVNAIPFVITVIMAASTSYITPISYQTNLMVYGPGGYKFTDFVKLGVPLTLVLGAVAVFLIPQVWRL